MPVQRNPKSTSSMAWLTDAIADAARSANYCVSGSLPKVDLGLDVEGLGPIRMPLKAGVAKQLMARCRTAPYGKGTQTLVDTKVRKTFELDPKQFVLGDAWQAAIADVTQEVAGRLGLPTDRLEPRLYKLLVYGSGGFFLSHRDSEKQNRMVGSLIVVLPTPFDGGNLLVRHGLVEQRITFAKAAAGEAPSYAAFYADCEHEVRPVTRGVRLALAYNLVLKPQRKRLSVAGQPTAPEDVLATAITAGVSQHPARPLVFALDHHYTQRGLSLDLLKGSDRTLADMLVPAAETAGCRVSLAQVERHLLQAADDGRYGYNARRSYGRVAATKIEIGETYEDTLQGTQWTDPDGKKQPWGAIPLDVSAIVSSVPIDQWTPTTEDYEGYTGNAGNTLDRWYHRAAIVVWRSDDHFAVIARAGVLQSIPLLGSMVAKLAKTPKKRLDEARQDCLRFAHAIIAEWPRRRSDSWPLHADAETTLASFAEHLLLLHDRDTLAMFLNTVAERDETLALKSFVVSACGEFGANTFARELVRLVSLVPDYHGQHELRLRDVQWLSALCCGRGLDADAARLAGQLCAVAVERFCEPLPPQSPYVSQRSQREPSVSEQALPWLVKALVAQERDKELARVLAFVQASPKHFRFADCQVPSLKTVISWSRKRFGQVPPLIVSWLASVRSELERATFQPPQTPADWSRPALVSCACRVCAELNAFLADPTRGVGKIAAREHLRGHLIEMIRRHQCDVTHAVERQGSPFSLVLTKTTGSFARAANQYKADCKLLADLPTVAQE